MNDDYRLELEEAAFEASKARQLGHSRSDIGAMSDLALNSIVMSDAPARVPNTYFVEGKGWVEFDPDPNPITAEDIQDLDECEPEFCPQDDWADGDSDC